MLIAATQKQLPAVIERRLKRLAEKSEQGRLKVHELEEYRELVQQAEQLHAERIAALAKLARQWEKPIQVVKREIRQRGGEHGAGQHSTHRSTSEGRYQLFAAGKAYARAVELAPDNAGFRPRYEYGSVTLRL